MRYAYPTTTTAMRALVVKALGRGDIHSAIYWATQEALLNGLLFDNLDS